MDFKNIKLEEKKNVIDRFCKFLLEHMNSFSNVQKLLIQNYLHNPKDNVRPKSPTRPKNTLINFWLLDFIKGKF